MADRSFSLASDYDLGMEIEEAETPKKHPTRGRWE